MLQLARDIKEKASGKKIAIMGVGTFTTLNMRFLLELGLDICFFVDKNFLNRKFFERQWGYQVVPYEKLDPKEHFPFVYQHNFLVVDSIASDLQRCGFRAHEYLTLPDIADRDLWYGDMQIGKGASSYDVLLGWVQDVKSIGRYSSINHTAQVVADHNKFHLTTTNSRYSPPPPRNRITIGNDIWIGANAVINASKVNHIGNGAIIGTGTVVINDIPPYAIVVGVPGVVKKFRFTEEEIDVLERVQWWNWDEMRIKENSECFNDPKLFFKKFKKSAD